MPFVFTIAGVLLIVAGVRGQTSQLFALVKSDFTGSPNYFEWMVAIFIVGAIGYIQQLATISRMFMFLIMAGLLYKNKQVFSQFGQEETGQAIQPTSSSIGGISTGATGVPLPSLPSLPSTTVLGVPIGASGIGEE